MLLKNFLPMILFLLSLIAPTYAQDQESLDSLRLQHKSILNKIVQTEDEETLDTLKKELTGLAQTIHQREETKPEAKNVIEEIDIEKELQKRLTDLYERLSQANADVSNVIAIVFTPNLLSKEKNNVYQTLLSSWKKILSNTREQIKVFAEGIKNDTNEALFDRANIHVIRLETFASFFLELYFKLELLTIDVQDSKQAYLTKAFSRSEIQTLMLALWKKLDHACNMQECCRFSFDTTKTLCNLLSSDIIGTWFSRIFAISSDAHRAKKLYLLLSVAYIPRLMQESITLTYLSFMKNYHSNAAIDKEQLDTLVSLFEARYDRIKESGPSSHTNLFYEIFQQYLMIVNLFKAKLLSIKQELSQKEKLSQLAKNKPEKVDLFITYTSLMTPEKIQELIDQINPIYDYAYGCCSYDENKEDDLQKLFIDYKIAVEHYFNHDENTVGELLTIGTLKHQLLDIAKDYDRSYVSLGLFGTKKEAKNVHEFIGLLDSIENNIKASLNMHDNTLWQLLLSNPKHMLEKIQSSKGFVKLAQASPLLGIALLKFVSPYVNPELKNRILAFLGADTDEKTVNKNELVEFIKSNPEIAEQLQSAAKV